MSIKSKGRKIGRMVRKVTGIKLPTAMKIGKLIAQDREFELTDKFPEFCSKQKEFCECCGPRTVLKGPRGSVADWCITESVLAREIRILEKISQVPFGVAVSAE